MKKVMFSVLVSLFLVLNMLLMARAEDGYISIPSVEKMGYVTSEEDYVRVFWDTGIYPTLIYGKSLDSHKERNYQISFYTEEPTMEERAALDKIVDGINKRHDREFHGKK